jgi:hypothetical protein
MIMSIDLTNDEIELLYYCLEQQENGFNPDEQKLCHQMIAKFHTAQATPD